MELLKKNIRMNRQKSRAVNQMTLGEDINIPDSKPDAESIIQESGILKIEEMKVQEGSLALNGWLEVKILYVSEGEAKQIHRLNVRIPFDEKLNLEQAQPGDNISLKWDLEDLGVHLINSRKLSVQALVTLRAAIEELYDTQAGVEVHGMDSVSTKIRELEPLTLEVQKRDILRVKDEIILASNKPNIREILWESVQLRGTDVKAVDGKLDIRGELFVFVLYMSDDEAGTKQWIEAVIPFRELVECAGCTAEMIPDVTITLTESSVEARPDYDGEARVVQVEAVLELDIKLYEETEVEILEDVYSPLMELKPIFRQEVYESLLVRNFSKCRVSERIQMEAKAPRILQICHSQGEVQVDEITRVPEGIRVDGVISVAILYITADDTLPFARMRGVVPFHHVVEVNGMDENCRYSLKSELEQLATTMIDSEEIEVKATLNLNVLVVSVHEADCIVSIEEAELDMKKMQEMPGIVGYVVQPDDSLWSIAKTYYTTPANIRTLNKMEEEDVRPGMKLLITKAIEKIS